MITRKKRRVRNFQTRSETVIQNSRLAKAKYESLQLLAQIRRLTSGKQSAQTALAEIQVLLNDNFNVKKLLDTQVPPKFAKVAQRGRKSNAAKAAAQPLQSSSEQAFRIDNTNRSLHYEFGTQEGTQVPTVFATCDDDKENCAPTTLGFSLRAQNDASEDILDDLPISSWPRRRKGGAKGRKGRFKDIGMKTAASRLMRLSHFR